MSEKKLEVVIIGVGLAGSVCASALDTAATKGLPVRITAVDTRTESISKYAGCRAAALGKQYAYRVTIPNHNLITSQNGEIIHKMVTAIDENKKEVVFDDQTRVKWDVLVCASGARNVSPCEPPLEAKTFKEQVAYYEETAAHIRNSSHITVLGSGAVGTELAGEIKCHYPDKGVAILSPGSVLVDGCKRPPPKRFFSKVTKAADKMGLKTYLDQRPVNISLRDFQGKAYLAGRREIMTDLGEKFTTDLVLLCTGKRLNNEIYPDSWKTPEGTIPVRPTLQHANRDDVFAIGDINNVDETKQGYFAQKQARVAVKNIEAMYKSKPNLRTYKPQSITQILIPLGREVGISYVGGIVLGSLVTSRLKGKDLFVKDHWSLYRVRKALMPEDKPDWEQVAEKTFKTTPRYRGGAITAFSNLGSSFMGKRSSVNRTKMKKPALEELDELVTGKDNSPYKDEDTESWNSSGSRNKFPTLRSIGERFGSKTSNTTVDSAKERTGAVRRFSSNHNLKSIESVDTPSKNKRKGRRKKAKAESGPMNSGPLSKNRRDRPKQGV